MYRLSDNAGDHRHRQKSPVFTRLSYREKELSSSDYEEPAFHLSFDACAPGAVVEALRLRPACVPDLIRGSFRIVARGRKRILKDPAHRRSQHARVSQGQGPRPTVGRNAPLQKFGDGK